MQSKADTDANGTLTLAEWFALAAEILEKERDKSVGPQTPQLIVPSALKDLSLVRCK
jgi:hypothetical protein